ncbi:FHA domain-containing protein [Curtobacterium sp. 458]|uniref:FHA domain-containing protein n=1 Tax=Curtobacterium sp. 458 TaxID=3050069 RepID=UPI0025B54C7C|nr:FHA domain-containing protein [Curtobacterium sp. 458]WJX99193.1 FHA domain-containing protein [Curtobacterium sp. 458]
MRDDDTADEGHGTADGVDDVDVTVIRHRRDARGSVDTGRVHPGNVDAGSDDPLGDTVIRSRGRRSAEPDADTVIRPRPDGSDDPFGDTVIRTRSGDTSSRAVPDDDTVVRPARSPRGGPGPATDDAVRGAPARPDADRGPSGGPAPGLQADAPRTTRTPSVRIGDHVLRLDRPVVVGRRPALPRIVRGPEPLLVTVHSASGQVSSSHVLLQASGEAAVVEDLRSTNGTVVRPVAGKPFRLASGGSAVVLTGTVVEIGDGNAVEILSPHLRVPPADPVPAPPDWP